MCSYKEFGFSLLLVAALSLTACKSHYTVADVQSRRVAIDKRLDVAQSADVTQMLVPYRASIDSMMNSVIGTAAVDMERNRPEGRLCNLVAELLRQSAAKVLGKPADMGLMNVGGLRIDVLPKGEITVGTAYQLLPFENSLCVLTLKGSDVKKLFHNLAHRGGEGVSGVHLVFNKQGEVLESTIQGEPVDDNRLYTIGTIDYLSEGNDGMSALPNAVKRDCPDGLTLRSLFIDFVRQETSAGRVISAELDGRITIKD